MKQYVEQCPFLGTHRGIVSSVIKDDAPNIQANCPFLKEAKSPQLIKQVAPQIKEDIIEGESFENIKRNIPMIFYFFRQWI